MLKVGDETEGYCPRCRLNTYQIISATDGREIFTSTCRTCRNTFQYKPELPLEEVREKQIKKLRTLQKKRVVSNPDIVQFASRKNSTKGDMDMPLRAYREMMGKDPETTMPSQGGPIREPVREVTVSGGAETATARWTRLTATLGARDGRPYNPSRTYKVGDVLLHKSHGLGLVETVIHEGAAMVLFRDVEQVLEMGAPAVETMQRR
jgi:transposase-like protein